MEGLEPAGGPPEELRRFIKRDVEKWRNVISKAQIKRVP
jgi:tripartite-type tricarboxylate transporter receptor subunit TctC